jgi:hypothetical protein
MTIGSPIRTLLPGDGPNDDSGDEGEDYADNEEALDDDNDENIKDDDTEERTNFETLTLARTCLFFPYVLQIN